MRKRLSDVELSKSEIWLSMTRSYPNHPRPFLLVHHTHSPLPTTTTTTTTTPASSPTTSTTSYLSSSSDLLLPPATSSSWPSTAAASTTTTTTTTILLLPRLVIPFYHQLPIYSTMTSEKRTSYHGLGSFALHSNHSLRSKVNDYYSHYSYILPLRLCPPYSYHLPPTPSSWLLQLLTSTYFTSISSTSTYLIPHLQFYYDYLDYHQRRAACQTSKPYSDCE